MDEEDVGGGERKRRRGRERRKRVEIRKTVTKKIIIKANHKLTTTDFDTRSISNFTKQQQQKSITYVCNTRKDNLETSL